MDSQLNDTRPLVMHIDLNSCFAIIEQQANPLIRHRPVVVAAYASPRGMILASSYEAKALGIKLGLSVSEARQRCPSIIVLTPDPEKYFDAHRRFRDVLLRYTSAVTPKSIDEFVVDFSGSPLIQQGVAMTEIGYRIKHDIKQALGEYVTVNVGIGTNRFLAKLAAGLHKPDGLDVITADNLRETYAPLNLVDLPGINRRFRTRLNVEGIWTPLQFLDADALFLKKRVFRSSLGLSWYLRLRGHEVDNVTFARKSFGQQYALGHKTREPRELARLFMKLCEKAGRRMRTAGFSGGGVQVYMSLENGAHYLNSHKVDHRLHSTQDIFNFAWQLVEATPIRARVTNIGVTVYDVQPAEPEQLGLFDDSRLDTRSLARAADVVNNCYGEFTLVPAIMSGMQQVILKRVAFGSVSDIQ